jgi:hypothetical protein
MDGLNALQWEPRLSHGHATRVTAEAIRKDEIVALDKVGGRG